MTLPGGRSVASEKMTGTSDGWKPVELRIEPKPEGYYISINLEISGERNGNGNVWVDDVYFMEVAK